MGEERMGSLRWKYLERGQLEGVHASKIIDCKLIVPLGCDRHFVFFVSELLNFHYILSGRNYNYLYFIGEETVAWTNCFTFVRSHREP